MTLLFGVISVVTRNSVVVACKPGAIYWMVCHFYNMSYAFERSEKLNRQSADEIPKNYLRKGLSDSCY